MEIANPEEYRKQYQQELEQDKQARVNAAWNKQNPYAVYYSPDVMQKYSQMRANGDISVDTSGMTSAGYYNPQGLGLLGASAKYTNHDNGYAHIRDAFSNSLGGLYEQLSNPLTKSGQLSQRANSALDEYDKLYADPYAYDTEGNAYGGSSGSTGSSFGEMDAGDNGGQQPVNSQRQQGINPTTTDASVYPSSDISNNDITQYNSNNLYDKYKQQQAANNLALKMGGRMY